MTEVSFAMSVGIKMLRRFSMMEDVRDAARYCEESEVSGRIYFNRSFGMSELVEEGRMVRECSCLLLISGNAGKLYSKGCYPY